MAARTVRNILTRPDGTPITQGGVTIKLAVAAFDTAGQREVLWQVYAPLDPVTGAWEASLEVNDDLDPAGTYYTVREPKAPLWTFVVPPGSGDLWLRDLLVTDPTPPAQVGVVLPAGGVPGQVLGLLSDGTLGWLTPTSGSGDLIYGAGVYGSGVYSPSA